MTAKLILFNSCIKGESMMRRLVMGLCAAVLASGATMAQDDAGDWAIVLHGGAGVIERGDMWTASRPNDGLIILTTLRRPKGVAAKGVI